MSITYERKFAFLGSKKSEISNKILDFFIKLGANNTQGLLCRGEDMYYFIDETNKIDCSLILPEGYIHQLQTYLNIMKNQKEKIPEYVECIKENPHYNVYGELGKIYKVLDWNSSITDCMLKGTTSGSTDKTRFKPSTKEAYDAQNTYLKAADYVPQVGDYVVMEKAGGWGYSPDNDGCVAIVNRVGKNRVDRDEVFSIWGEVINPNKDHAVKFSNIPQIGYNKRVIFRKALPHEIPSSNVKAEPQQQVEEWSIETYAVAIKGNFGVFSFSTNRLPIGKIFTISRSNHASRDSVGVIESQYWIYKANLKWFATYEEAVQFSKRLPQFEASPTAAVSEGPLEICRRKYKKGMLVRSAKEYGEYSGEFIIDVDPSEFTNTGSGVDYFTSRGWLYIEGKFAEILEESKEKVIQYPITPENAFPVKAIEKQIKKNKFQEVHEIKTVEEKLLKKTKSKLFNI